MAFSRAIDNGTCNRQELLEKFRSPAKFNGEVRSYKSWKKSAGDRKADKSVDGKTTSEATSCRDPAKNVMAASDEDSWETKFNDEGDPISPDAIRELELALGKVKVTRPEPIDYLSFKPNQNEKPSQEWNSSTTADGESKFKL